MRCPYCAGEIQDGSVFCGICGKPTATDDAAASSGSAAQTAERSGATRQADATSPSLFELPVSPGARVARIAVVLVLDALLLIAGIAMIVSYLNDRDRARSKTDAPPETRPAPTRTAGVEFAEPVPLNKAQPVTPTATRRRAEARRSARAGKRHRKRRRVGRRITPPPAGRKPGPGPADAGVAARGGADAATAAVVGTDAGSAADPDGLPDAEVAILARQIRLVVNRERRLLQRCYDRAAKMTTVDKALQGRVEIRFEVLPDGKTENVSPHGNTTGSSSLASCVANLIRNWKFPSHAGKRGIPFVWPFDFRGS